MHEKVAVKSVKHHCLTPLENSFTPSLLHAVLQPRLLPGTVLFGASSQLWMWQGSFGRFVLMLRTLPRLSYFLIYLWHVNDDMMMTINDWAMAAAMAPPPDESNWLSGDKVGTELLLRLDILGFVGIYRAYSLKLLN